MSSIQTPSRIVGTPMYPNILGNEDMDVTYTEETSRVNVKQLDVIASNVNNTIQELNSIYKDIGYPKSEIKSKKSEIFKVIEETIQRFTSNLEREKVGIESECEWLRQQIKLILGMINDKEGTKNLSDMSRGIVFEDMLLYEQGFTNELKRKLSLLKSKRENFYEDSPFNVTNNTSNIMEEISFEKKYEQMLENLPSLSLLKLKRELNNIFLDVVKVFVKAFKKLNQGNLVFLDMVETIGITKQSVINFDLTEKLPVREEAEFQKELIDQFETTIRHLKLGDSKSTSFSNFADETVDDVTFVVSSPRKAKITEEETPIDRKSPDYLLGYLRDINYKLIKSIRSLKVSKITGELITELNKQINYCEVEVEDRRKKMTGCINQIFDLVDTLGYNEEQLISIQKQFNEREKEKEREASTDSNDSYFDLETLKFIQFNPSQFGLNDNHLSFIENFMNLLTKVKETKQKKMDYYIGHCTSLWGKLGEEERYVAEFVSRNNDLTDTSLNQFKHELQRLLARRSEFIDSFISDARKEIENYWQMLYYTANQKSRFKYFEYVLDPNESYDKETILNEHEQEVQALKQEYESKKEIFERYAELQSLLKDQEFLIESSKDSARLLSKNSCKILLNEERIRKNVLKSMPRLIDTLKTLTLSYNKSHESLKIFGQDFYQGMVAIDNEQRNRGRKKPEPVSRPTANKAIPVNRTVPRPGRAQISPNKTFKPQRPAQRPNDRISPVRNNGKRLSPVSYNNQVRKPVKLVRNPTIKAERLASAINNSIQDQTQTSQFSHSSSQISPYALDKRSYNSSILKSFGTQLQPLNSPLIANQADSKKSSPLSRVSPIRMNGFVEDKENKRTEEEMTLNVTPIRKDMTRYTSTPASAQADSSSNLGEEYLNWRSEKLGQLN